MFWRKIQLFWVWRSKAVLYWFSIKVLFGCSIDTAQQQMVLNFELVVSNQLFLAVLVTYKWFKFQHHLPPCGVNVLSSELTCVPIKEWDQGLRMPSEEIVFTAQPKIKSQSQIFRYGRSIFCLPHQPKFSDFFDFCNSTIPWWPKIRTIRGPPVYVLGPILLADTVTDTETTLKGRI